jgi:hypothetical protein
MLKHAISIAILALAGCNQTAQVASGWRGQTFTKPADFLERVGQIEVGATRQETVDIIGPFDMALSPIEFLPVCDSYGYIENGKQVFLQIWYHPSNKVQEVNAGLSSPCGIV